MPLFMFKRGENGRLRLKKHTATSMSERLDGGSGWHIGETPGPNRATQKLVGAWHFDNPDPNKGLGLLDYEDSLFQPDDTRLQKHYFYGDGSNGRKDLQQVTHRLFKSDATDQNGVLSN
jgi:hypothetical protein